MYGVPDEPSGSAGGVREYLSMEGLYVFCGNYSAPE